MTPALLVALRKAFYYEGRDFFHCSFIFIDTYKHRDNADKTRVSTHFEGLGQSRKPYVSYSSRSVF